MMYILVVSCIVLLFFSCVFFFFNDTATTEIYTLSLHDALPISHHRPRLGDGGQVAHPVVALGLDRKSTRLNSSHLGISYAVFCLKKKKIEEQLPPGLDAGLTAQAQRRHRDQI